MTTPALNQTSRGFLSVYRKGREAAKNGQARKSPYADKRGGCFQHVITWSRSFQKYWLEGFDDENGRLPDRYTLKPKTTKTS